MSGKQETFRYVQLPIDDLGEVYLNENILRDLKKYVINIQQDQSLC